MRARMRQRSVSLFRSLISFLAISLLVFGSPLTYLPVALAEQDSGDNAKANEEQPEIDFSVTKSTGPNTEDKPATVASTEALSPQLVDSLLKRLAQPPRFPSKPFVLPEQSLVRPKLPGIQTLEVFPPPPAASNGAHRPEHVDAPVPLKVVRISPEGAIETVNQLTITFSQPMVPISEAKTTELSKFATITPQPPGSWQWAGTQTLLFKPDGKRFPRSTSYKILVPKGIQSVSGVKLEDDIGCTLIAPTITIQQFEPYANDTQQGANPFMLARFDQDIDPAAILRHVSLKVHDKNYDLRQLNDKELKEKSWPGPYVNADDHKRWLAFKAVKALPLNSKIDVVFEKGCPSLEGPLTTLQPHNCSFRTYGPLQLLSFPHESSGAADSWNTMCTFSNQLNYKSGDSTVKFSPANGATTVNSSGPNIWLNGGLKPLTGYTMTFGKNLTDIFGQRLGTDITISFVTGALPTAVRFDKPFMTIPFGHVAHCPFHAQGTPKVKATIYWASPELYDRYRSNPDVSALKSIFGDPVAEKTLSVGPDEEYFFADLQPFLKSGYGQFAIAVETVGLSVKEQRSASAWVQITDIGLDTFKGRLLGVLATSISDGKPLANVQLSTTNPGSGKGVTDAGGLAKIDLREYSDDPIALVARSGGDTALLPMIYGGGSNPQTHRQTVYYAVTDRDLYKPGETIKVKGWVRQLSFDQKDAIKVALPDIGTICYKAMSVDSTELTKGEVKVDTTGGFTFEFQLPAKMNLGNGQIMLGEKSPQLATSSDNVVPSPRRTQPMVASLYEHQIGFNVQEFRRPEFELKVNSSLGNTMLVGDTTTVTATAKYLATGALSGAPMQWAVRAFPSNYSPPGHSGFQFGRASWMILGPAKAQHQETNMSRTLKDISDYDGSAKVNIHFNRLESDVPVSVQCEATVKDVNRQTWSDKVDILVHPADRLSGIKIDGWQHYKDKPFNFQLVSCDLDGHLLADLPLEVQILRSKSNGVVSEISKETVVSESIAKSLSFTPAEGGDYGIFVRMKDGKGRGSLTSLQFNVQDRLPDAKTAEQDTLEIKPDKDQYKAGETASLTITSPFAPSRGVITIRRNYVIESIPITMDELSTTIKIPVTEKYYPNFQVSVFLAGKAGKSASGACVLKVPPLLKTLTLSALPASGEVLPGKDTSISVDLKDADGNPVINGQVALEVVDEALLALAGYKWGDPLEVFYPQSASENADTHLRPSIILPETIPDGKTNERNRKNRFGVPPVVTGTVELEEARPGGMNTNDGYFARFSFAKFGSSANMLQVEPTVMDERHYSSGRAERYQKSSPILPAINIRTNFSSLALFAPVVVTDHLGKARVTFHMPDSATRYRIMAVAVGNHDHGDQFGSTEGTITAKQPLIVKPSPPRFLNFGDNCELPVVLQNQTDRPLRTTVVLRARNAQVSANATERADALPVEQTAGITTDAGNMMSAQGELVEIPAHDRVEVRFQVSTIETGHAAFQCVAISDALSDAADFTIPVMVPATFETFATYGQIDEGAALQKLATPKDVFQQLGGLAISTSSTAVQALTDAFLYLKHYDFQCSEQLSSKLITCLALQNVLSAFEKLDAGEIAELKKYNQSLIDDLLTRQNGDGSFGLWKPNEDKPWPFVSLQVGQALALAVEKGYVVKPYNLDLCKSYLKNVEQYIPSDYSPQVRLSIRARALNVRYLNKDIDTKKAKELLQQTLADEVEKEKSDGVKTLSQLTIEKARAVIPLEMAGWLLPVISGDKDCTDEIAILRRLIDSQIKETASTASTNDSGYGPWNYCMFYSPRRTDAIVLEALIKDQPDNPLIPKLVKGLLACRKNGVWDGTQENGSILQALDLYFEKYEAKVPDFLVQTWLGTTLVASQKFIGRTTETKESAVPMAYLAKSNAEDVLVSKTGPGRLYYRIGLDYIPKSLNLKPADFGFTVTRKFEAVDKKSDVRQDTDGTWRIKAGASVRSSVHLASLGARYHVVLVAPLPGGAEPINSALAGNRSLLPGEAADDDDSVQNVEAQMQPIQRGRGYRNWWHWTWYEHENLRDHQAEAFASLLPAGEYDYSYMMRATTPGDFHVAPAKAEEMYATETFGRSGTEHVIIE